MNDILEIGGSNGALAKAYLEKNQEKKITWTIVEPGPSISDPDARLKIISDFFPTQKIAEKKYEGVIHSHVLEHMYDPTSFLQNVTKNLKIGGYHLFSVPNLLRYVLNKQVNALNFEHTILLSEEIIDHLLQNAGFEIVDKQYYLEHSIFYATKYSGQKKVIPFPNNYTKYKNIFTEYIQSIKSVADYFESQTDISNDRTYIFGAHVFTQLLLNLGLTEGKLSAVLDNSKHKQGKRLYGTNLFVKSLEIVKNDKKPKVIVHAGQYQDEIKEQLISINPKVKIIEMK